MSEPAVYQTSSSPIYVLLEGIMPVDYSLYLVTDSSPKLLGDRKLCDVVRQAVEGGVFGRTVEARRSYS